MKGLFLYSARFLLPLLCVVAAFVQPSNGVFIFLLLVPAAATVFIYLYSPLDAYAIAKRAGPDYQLKEYNRSSLYWLLIAMQLAYPVALTWGTREYVYEPFLIPTRSMSPNVLAGDRVLVNKQSLRNDYPERGDVIAFRAPASETASIWVKRVLGVAGDRILIRGREIEVNGKKLERERVPMAKCQKVSAAVNVVAYVFKAYCDDRPASVDAFCVPPTHRHLIEACRCRRSFQRKNSGPWVKPNTRQMRRTEGRTNRCGKRFSCTSPASSPSVGWVGRGWDTQDGF